MEQGFPLPGIPAARGGHGARPLPAMPLTSLGLTCPPNDRILMFNLVKNWSSVIRGMV